MVTSICNDSTSESGTNEIVGTRIILLIIFLIIELIVISYVFMNTCDRDFFINNCNWKNWNCKRRRKISRKRTRTHSSKLSSQPIVAIDKKLKLCLWIYHISALIQLILSFIVYLISIIKNTDLSTNYSCYANIFLYFCPTIFFATFTVFWNIRLGIVFKSSAYQVSKVYNVILYSLICILFIGGFMLVLIEFIIVLKESLVDDDMNNVFCLERIKIIDFFPYIRKNPTTDWSGKTVNNPYFYDCKLDDNKQVIKFWSRDLGVIIAGFSVPMLNIIISIQYIRKLYSTTKGLYIEKESTCKNRNKNETTMVDIHGSGIRKSTKMTQIARVSRSKNEEKRLSREKQKIYRNGITALTSVLSTWICLIVYSRDPGNLAVLTYFDAVFNGILMISVFRFGGWIFDLLCINSCHCLYDCCHRCSCNCNCSWGDDNSDNSDDNTDDKNNDCKWCNLCNRYNYDCNCNCNWCDCQCFEFLTKVEALRIRTQSTAGIAIGSTQNGNININGELQLSGCRDDHGHDRNLNTRIAMGVKSSSKTDYTNTNKLKPMSCNYEIEIIKELEESHDNDVDVDHDVDVGHKQIQEKRSTCDKNSNGFDEKENAAYFMKSTSM